MDPRLDMMSSAKKHELPFTPLYINTVLGNVEKVKIMIEGGFNPLDSDINDETLLHFAAHWGSLDVLKYLIEDVGCNPATEGWHGDTALHTAALEGKLLVMKYLIEDCAMEVATPDNAGLYPLHLACWHGNLEAVQYLVQRMQEYGELVSVKAKSGQQPIHIAAACGHLEVVKYLINYNAAALVDDNGVTTLIYASHQGHLDVVRYLTLQHNCDPMTVHDKDSGNCLHIAACKGHVDKVRFFVKELECDIYAKNSFNYYPIHSAAESGNLELFKFFVEELDCDPLSEIDSQLISTLHVAAANGHLSIVQYLIETKKCDPMFGRDNGKQSAIDVATAYGQLNILQYYLERSIPVGKNLTDSSQAALLPYVKRLMKTLCRNYELNPLHYAAKGGYSEYLMDHHSIVYNPSVSTLVLATASGHLDIVKQLIGDMKYDHYITAHYLLLLAAMEGHTKLVRYFVEDLKLDPTKQDEHKNCPLHFAAMFGRIETFDYFITELKCDINTPVDEKLPIHFAIMEGQLNFVRYLLEQPNCDVTGHSRGAPYSTLHLAARYGQLNIIQCLLSPGEIDPFHPDLSMSRDTAIHYAAVSDKLEVVKFYVDTFGSKSLKIRNNNGQTPLDVALRNNSGLTAFYLTVMTFMLLQ